MHSIDFKEKLARLTDHWSPRIIAEMNDYQFKLVKIQGDFVWHSHPETDEAFIILEGELLIEFRDGKVELKSGEMFVVPKVLSTSPMPKRNAVFYWWSRRAHLILAMLGEN